MTTMEVLATAVRAGRAAAKEQKRERQPSSIAAAVVEHGLSVVGLSCFVGAALMVAIPLGLLVAGAALFVLEWRLGE